MHCSWEQPGLVRPWRPFPRFLAAGRGISQALRAQERLLLNCTRTPYQIPSSVSVIALRKRGEIRGWRETQ